MIRLSITMDAADTQRFLVRYIGTLEDRTSLNQALASRLADELQDHFRDRNREPNKMGATKTNFWQEVAEATAVDSVTADGAEVAIAETRFRIHLFGGTIRPTGGRKFLTIPLIKEARGLRVADYEKQTGNKLFRLPGTGVLVERSDQGDRSVVGGFQASVRRRGGGFANVNVRPRSQVRGVFALKESVTIKQDPRALPDSGKLLDALREEGEDWIARQARKGALS